ncbi:shikimate dehydrogenase [Phytohabitans sp. ZYX-F-186]|uniref:Shikimate dehydrogenase (NADP(+)) n=1 Tax=Phytohabitans maris TaxID=3071409 RepID=A0ABU0ZCX9_9ACTN|nr:shikimate dehydrogenase [Phytohabitans sp. ZYX-F-186]MDQ7904823.1 shikimate dehydrogenase [Phytohabitans sp. ZYX-F-186]
MDRAWPEGRFLVGLVGAGIDSSLSPPLHEREADNLGLRYLYQLIDIGALGLPVEATGELLWQARRMGFRGLNITHPCKQVAVGHLDRLSPDAAAIGAVNTVVWSDGTAVGYNTDWSGFTRSFERGLPGASVERVVLLGAGGAGSAVAHAVLWLGADRLTVVDADAGRAARLVELLAGRFGVDRVGGGGPDLLEESLRAADGLVNATPVGMVGHPGIPLPLELLHPELWVADVVYRPLETELLAHARRLGCRTLGGGGMVVFQAAEAFRLFAGVAPDPERMLRHFESLTRVDARP